MKIICLLKTVWLSAWNTKQDFTIKVNGYQRFSKNKDLNLANSTDLFSKFMFLIVNDSFMPVPNYDLNLPIKIRWPMSDFSNNFVRFNSTPFLQHSASIQSTTNAQNQVPTLHCFFKKKIRFTQKEKDLLLFHYIATWNFSLKWRFSHQSSVLLQRTKNVIDTIISDAFFLELESLWSAWTFKSKKKYIY